MGLINLAKQSFYIIGKNYLLTLIGLRPCTFEDILQKCFISSTKILRLTKSDKSCINYVVIKLELCT